MATWTDHARSRLRPTKALIHDAVDATTFLVEEGHDAVADVVVGAASTVPELRAGAATADAARRAVTGGVLATVRAVNRAVEAASDAALDLAPLQPGDEPAVPLRSDHLVSVDGALDQLVGVLNGAVGDHLARVGSGFDQGLRLRSGDQWLPASPSALAAAVPTAGDRVVVFIHGLSTTELSWCLDAARNLGAPDAHFGALLERERGLTPVFVRYNTGRTVAESGAALSAALDVLVAGWPVPVAQLVLVGHSMGGLVSRAATHTAAAAAAPWLDRLTHVACLGSPHQGAPLARLGHSAVGALRAVPHPATRVLGRILAHRSAGIQDLRHRALPALGPLRADVRYLFVAGTLSQRAHHPTAHILGDMLVPVASAGGPGGADVQVRHFGVVAHHQLQTHAGVYAALAGWLAEPRPLAG